MLSSACSTCAIASGEAVLTGHPRGSLRVVPAAELMSSRMK
jgi:hypothetical protein